MNISSTREGPRSATAFAPATVGNAGVGFDVLGFAVDCVGDKVTVTKTREQTVVIEQIIGAAGAGAIPLEASRNTATVGLIAMMNNLMLTHGFSVRIEKGIPLGSGMGGSAASAVAAAVAANALLAQSLGPDEILSFALAGEFVASGSAHPDNAAPCLFGGLTLALESGEIVQIPVPKDVHCILIHPHLSLETRTMREVLSKDLSLAKYVQQSALLAGFISGCYEGNLARIGKCLADTVIEPQRKAFIPGFDAAKDAAMHHGALGFSISGSGPSVFAWAPTTASARAIQRGVQEAFTAHGIQTDAWISPISPKGAHVVSTT